MLEDFGVGAVLLKLLETRINFVFSFWFLYFLYITLLFLSTSTSLLKRCTSSFIPGSHEFHIHPARLDQALCRPCPKRHHNERSSRWRMRGMSVLRENLENQRSDGKALCHGIRMYHDVSSCIIRSNLEWFGLLTEMESTILWWYKTGWRKTAGKTHECVCSFITISHYLYASFPMVRIAEWSNHKKRGIKIMRYRNEYIASTEMWASIIQKLVATSGHIAMC